MEPEDYAAWIGFNGRLLAQHSGHHATTPCDDCLLPYAIEMRAVGKCNGHPAGVESDEDEPDEPAERRRAMATTVRSIVTGPDCQACVHLEVCNRREAIVDLDATDVEMETLPKGLSVVVSAQVECDAYARISHRGGPRQLSEAGREALRASGRRTAALRNAKPAGEPELEIAQPEAAD